VDATTIELADMQQLSAEAPGRFRTLVEFSKAFPQLNFTVALANRSFANAHPDILKDYVRSILTVNRDMRANPQQLRDAMVKHLNYTPEQAQAIANSYLAGNVWDSNGGLSPESITTTLEFLAAHGILPADLKVEDVADLSYLNTVLDELGRK
jgi:ABC-type nitrate/sulfonate/bicarbonate transport system substrate-binding protein